jgi:hypothetical protein
MKIENRRTQAAQELRRIADNLEAEAGERGAEHQQARDLVSLTVWLPREYYTELVQVAAREDTPPAAYAAFAIEKELIVSRRPHAKGPEDAVEDC